MRMINFIKFLKNGGCANIYTCSICTDVYMCIIYSILSLRAFDQKISVWYFKKYFSFYTAFTHSHDALRMSISRHSWHIRNIRNETYCIWIWFSTDRVGSGHSWRSWSMLLTVKKSSTNATNHARFKEFATERVDSWWFAIEHGSIRSVFVMVLGTNTPTRIPSCQLSQRTASG